MRELCEDVLVVSVIEVDVFRYGCDWCSDYGEGVCADPGKRDATLGVGSPGPPGKGSEQQLVPDSGGGKT